MPNYFFGQILTVNLLVTNCRGKLVTSAGRPVVATNSLIEATVAQHGLILVTRNTKDFADLGLKIINPWE